MEKYYNLFLTYIAMYKWLPYAIGAIVTLSLVGIITLRLNFFRLIMNWVLLALSPIFLIPLVIVRLVINSDMSDRRIFCKGEYWLWRDL